MLKGDFSGQLKLDDILDTSYTDSDMIDEPDYLDFVSKIDKCKNLYDYKLDKKLYNEILSCDNPKVHLFLLGCASSFNRSFYGIHVKDENISEVDTALLFEKILSSKMQSLIKIALDYLKADYMYTISSDKLELEKIYNICVGILINYMKESDDISFVHSMLDSNINWNDYFDDLIEIIYEKNVTDKVLWHSIIKTKKLNGKNLSVLLEENITLMLMYMINSNTKFDSAQLEIINMCNSLVWIRKKIISISSEFYENRVKPLMTNTNSRYELDIKSYNIFRAYLYSYVFNSGEESKVDEYYQCSFFDDKNDNHKIG